MRTLDYLETRPDLEADRLTFLGTSLGAHMGPILMALDPRLRAGVLISGGMLIRRPYPEVDMLHFVSRVTAPVLMLNGTQDPVFPLEISQQLLHSLLGSDDGIKRHRTFDGGHGFVFLRRNDVIAEVLGWLDQHVGPIE